MQITKKDIIQNVPSKLKPICLGTLTKKELENIPLIKGAQFAKSNHFYGVNFLKPIGFHKPISKL